MGLTVTDVCRQLRLAYIAEAVNSNPDKEVAGIVENVLRGELEGRKRAKLSKLVNTAGFPHIKTFDGYVFEGLTFPPGCNREMLLSLECLRRKENVLILGAVGTGTTHMAIALGVEACRQGLGVQFYRDAELVAVLQEKFADGMLTRFRSKLRKMDLIILDEVGYVPFNQTGSELLFNVIAELSFLNRAQRSFLLRLKYRRRSAENLCCSSRLILSKAQKT